MFEVNNEEKRRFTGKVDEKGRLRCPMCKGRGYFEPTEQFDNGFTDEYFSVNDVRKDLACRLPALESKGYEKEFSKQNKKLTLPSIGRKNLPDKKSVYNLYQNKSTPLSRINERGSNPNGESEELTKLNSGLGLKGHFLKPITANSNSNESDLDNQLLPSPKTPQNPQEYLKSSLAKLKGNDWVKSLNGLKDIIQISRYHPDVLEGSMAVVYRGVISLLKSFRSKITRTACQAASELFSHVPNTQRPEFDELVSALLQKTADINKFVRRDANEALDSMVINIMTIHSVRTLVQKGISHRNSIVRAAAARLLVCIIGLVGVNNIFTGSRDTRSRILNAGAQCIQDGCQEVRSFGYRIIKMLMDHDDFEEALHGCVNSSVINKIEKILITIKYQK